MKNANSKNAFSLVEMAISMTIIGLLVAGVLTGQNVKHRQEITQIMTDIGSISSAVVQYKITYGNFYPGDYYNATTMWSTSTNGDGDNLLQTSNASTKNEELLFWQHLKLSGLLSSPLSGSYDGTTITGNGGIMIAPLQGGFYYAHKALNNPTATLNPTGRLIIQLSRAGTAGTGASAAGVLTNKDAYGIDTKYDNGVPLGISGTIAAPTGSFGTITAIDGNGAAARDCVLERTINSPTYNTFNSGNVGTPCVLYFFLE